jgi:hypothetical protein
MSAKKDLDDLRKKMDEFINSSKAAGKITKDNEKIFRRMVDSSIKNNDSLSQTKKVFASIKSLADQTADTLDYISKSFTESLQELTKQNLALNYQRGALRKLSSIADSLLDIRIGENTYTTKQVEKLKENARLEIKRLEKAKLLNDRAAVQTAETRKRSLELANQIKEADKVIRASNEILKIDKEINKNLGFTPKVLAGIDKSLQKLGFDSLGIDEAVKETKRLGQEAALTGQKFKPLSTFIKQLSINIRESLSFTKLLEVGISALAVVMREVDKRTGELAQTLGISYDQSLGLQKSFNQIAIESDSIFVTSKNISDSFLALNQNFQSSTGFSKEMLESFTKMTKQAGFTVETVSTLAKVTGTQGVELESNLALMQGEIGAMNALNKTSFSTKQVMEGMKEVNKGTLLTLKQFPGQLTKALFTSKKLALSFAEMESISSSLLDFEGSIQAELEAELLTGRNLNLERARSLALQGKVGEAAAEVLKQVKSSAEFGKMNVIQQEAMAKAVGLTRDQLANSLMEQEALRSIGVKDADAAKAKFDNLVKLYGYEKAVKELGNEQYAQQLKSQSIQERFAMAVESAKEAFIEVGTALMPIVSLIADVAGVVGKFVGKFGPLIKVLGAAYAIIKGMQVTFTAIKTTVGLINIMRQKGFVKAKAAQALNKIGLITDKQKLFYQNRIVHFQNVEAGTKKLNAGMDRASLLRSVRRTVVEKGRNALLFIRNQFKKEGIAYEAAAAVKGAGILALQHARNAAIFVGNQFTQEGLVYQGAIYTKKLAINAAEKINNTLSAIGAAIEKGKLRSMILQMGATIRNIGKLTIELGVRLGIMSAALATNSAVTFGVGAAIAVAAAVAGFYAIKALADDMIDPPAGYGKRRLMTPEGTIALNDKDTVIAGTNLIGNDVISDNAGTSKGPEGSISVENNSQTKELALIASGINTLINVNKQAASRNMTIEMAGEKVGAGIAQSERQIQ